MQPKKLLIITYYWPPAGGPGVQRWLKFVKYLPLYNIHPIVYAPKNAAYPLLDNSLIDDLKDVNYTLLQNEISEPNQWLGKIFHKKTKTISAGVIKHKSKQSFLEKILLFIRGNFYVPDSRITWVKPSVDYLKKYLKDHPVDAFITTGPPHSLHLIGLALKETFNFPWIADFRDPWLEINYHQQLYLTNFAIKRHQTLENQVLKHLDLLLTTSESTKNLLEKKTTKPVKTITNGYDNQKVLPFKKDEKFSISHIGSLLSNRNPLILWESLSELIHENSDFSKQFELKLIGKVSEDVIETLNKYKLNKHLKIINYVTHDEALKVQKETQILLLIEENSIAGSFIIAAKLFEYLIADAPIIAIGPQQSDVETIIKSTNTGQYFRYDDKIQLKNHIIHLFEAFENKSLKLHPIGIQNYHRQALTQKLVNLIPWES